MDAVEVISCDDTKDIWGTLEKEIKHIAALHERSLDSLAKHGVEDDVTRTHDVRRDAQYDVTGTHDAQNDVIGTHCVNSSVQNVGTATHGVKSDVQNDVTGTDAVLKVLLLGSIACTQLRQMPMEHLKRWFNQPDKTVVIYRKKSLWTALYKHCEQDIPHWAQLKTFDATQRRQVNYAIAEIKTLLADQDTPNNGNRFIFKPDTICQSMSEVMILKLEEEDSSCGGKFDTLFIDSEQDGCFSIEAKNIQANVWTFDPRGLPPGKHELHVRGDDTSLGTDTLTVLHSSDMAMRALTIALGRDPCSFLCKLFSLSVHDLDAGLASYLYSESALHLFMKILQHGDPKGEKYPGILHFCAAHGLYKCIDYLLRSQKGLREQPFIQNAFGLTPEELVYVADLTEEDKIQTLFSLQSMPEDDSSDDDSTDDIKPLISPKSQLTTSQGSSADRSSTGTSMFFNVRKSSSGRSFDSGNGSGSDHTLLESSTIDNVDYTKKPAVPSRSGSFRGTSSKGRYTSISPTHSQAGPLQASTAPPQLLSRLSNSYSDSIISQSSEALPGPLVYPPFSAQEPVPSRWYPEDPGRGYNSAWDLSSSAGITGLARTDRGRGYSPVRYQQPDISRSERAPMPLPMSATQIRDDFKIYTRDGFINSSQSPIHSSSMEAATPPLRRNIPSRSRAHSDHVMLTQPTGRPARSNTEPVFHLTRRDHTYDEALEVDDVFETESMALTGPAVRHFPTRAGAQTQTRGNTPGRPGPMQQAHQRQGNFFSQGLNSAVINSLNDQAQQDRDDSDNDGMESTRL